MNEPGKIILVTGGARSGKSEFAESLAERQAKPGDKPAYIATAQILDEEMEERVALHKKRRGGAWLTFEAPFQAEQAIRQAAERTEIILFDCLTLYVTNFLLADDDFASEGDQLTALLETIDQLIAAAKESRKTVIFVTNEVGAGIVPENALARKYRDWAGWVNQRVAQAADQVYLVVCGIPVDIKGLAENLEEGRNR